MKGRWPIGEARDVARFAVDVIDPLCCRVKVVGSIRRKKPFVGDADIVAVPMDGKDDDLIGCFRALGASDGNGKKTASVVIDGIQVDLWLVPDESWGAALCFATGPKEENIRLRAIAKRRGWKLSQYGLFDQDGKVLAGQTEDGIYEALGLPYLRPEERDGRQNGW